MTKIVCAHEETFYVHGMTFRECHPQLLNAQAAGLTLYLLKENLYIKDKFPGFFSKRITTHYHTVPGFLFRLDPGSCPSSSSSSSGIMSFPSAEVWKSSVALRLVGFVGSVAIRKTKKRWWEGRNKW